MAGWSIQSPGVGARRPAKEAHAPLDLEIAAIVESVDARTSYHYQDPICFRRVARRIDLASTDLTFREDGCSVSSRT